MSSPTQRNPSSSKYDASSPPMYPSTDRFNPLGFSTPQQQQRSGPSSQARNYYSAQPKYMLPKGRGFYNRQRNGQNQYHDRFVASSEETNAGDNNEQIKLKTDAGRQNNFTNWKSNHTRNQRYGGPRYQNNFRQNHQARSTSSNIDDYFHPSMLEDPWNIFPRKPSFRHERTECSVNKNRKLDDDSADDKSSSSDENDKMS